MKKRDDNLFVKNIALLEILLLISLSFAIAFLIGNIGFVSAQGEESFAIDPYLRFKAPSVTDAPVPIQTGFSSAKSAASAAPNAQPPPSNAPTTVLGRIYGGRAFDPKTGAGTTTQGVGGALVAGVAWAATAYIAVKLIGSLIGLDKGAQQALENA